MRGYPRRATRGRTGCAPESRPAPSHGLRRRLLASTSVDRPASFVHHRFLGDRRTQEVYDLDEVADEDVMAVVLEELIESGAPTCFAPDSLAEARNRGYRLRTV